MLKIRDDVDLKELEKFGFEYNNFCCYKYEDEHHNVIIGQDRIIHYNHFLYHNDLSNIIYDLIKAGLVEKVER